MLLFVGILAATGVAVSGAVQFAVVCVAMMAMMMLAMPQRAPVTSASPGSSTPAGGEPTGRWISGRSRISCYSSDHLRRCDAGMGVQGFGVRAFRAGGGRPWGAPKRVEIVDLLAQGGRVPRASEAGGGVPRGSARVSTAFFDDVDGVEPAMIEELKTRIQSGSVRVVDVRPWLEFESGHLPGAANIPLGELSARMGELDTSTPVIALPRAVLGARGAGRFTATRRRRGCPAPGRGPDRVACRGTAAGEGRLRRSESHRWTDSSPIGVQP